MDQKAARVIAYCASKGYPEPVAEHRFDDDRKFLFDIAWPEIRYDTVTGGRRYRVRFQPVALEFEGGVYGKGKPCPVCGRRDRGAHGSVTGILRDIEKYNLAALMGWRVFRVRPEQVESGEAFALIDQIFSGFGEF